MSAHVCDVCGERASKGIPRQAMETFVHGSHTSEMVSMKVHGQYETVLLISNRLAGLGRDGLRWSRGDHQREAFVGCYGTLT